MLPNEVAPDRWYIHDKMDTAIPGDLISPVDTSAATSCITIELKSLGDSKEAAIAQLDKQDSFSRSIAETQSFTIYNRSGDTPSLYLVTKDGRVGELPLPYADEALRRAVGRNTAYGPIQV